MTPTKKDILKTKEIVIRLFSYGLKKVILKQETIHNWRNENKSLLKLLNLKIVNGATKICIINKDKSYPWVIKIGFRSQSLEKEEIDFCQIEAENYKFAIEEKLDNFFAATYQICIIENIPIILQERVIVDSSAVKEEFSNYGLETGIYYTQSSCDSFDDEEDALRAVYEGLVKEKILIKLIDFVWDKNINDLHCENIGFRVGTYMPVLLDFSGYF